MSVFGNVKMAIGRSTKSTIGIRYGRRRQPPGEEGGRHADSSVGAAEAERDEWRENENVD